ncbi:MAG: RNA polymerase sigma factor [Oscillospiraceae bacterium]
MDSGESAYKRYLDGDESAVGEIIRDYKDGLILFINGFVRNPNVAEELCEDVFVKLFTKKPHFHGNSSFRTFLYSVGRNVALDYLRREKRRQNIGLDDCGEISDDEENLEKCYLREERKIAVHRAMAKLKEEQRQALWLIYFEDFTAKEVALVMKKTVHAAETLAYRARQALKAELEKEGFTYEEL